MSHINKRGALCSLFVASLLSLAPSFSSTARAEAMYQISENELATLERNFETLETHSKQKDGQLTALQTQLDEANKQLETSKIQNERTEDSLKKANEYLNKLEKEAAHKIPVEARQKRLWQLIAGGLAVYIVYDKTK